MPIQYGGPGVTPSLGNLVTTTVQLQSGEVWIVPAGRWSMNLGKYTSFQEYDPITTIWRTIGGGPLDAPQRTVFSDGVNYRLANQTGCPVGAVVTTAGSGYTAAPTVTASAGGSKWLAIVGGAINTTVTVTAGGSGYTYPPQVLFAAPPAGGVPATGYSTLTAGAVSSITVTDQGAGYTSAPTVTILNDPREGLNGTTVGTGAAATTTLTGAGTVTALVCVDHGTGGQTSVPTLTFSSGAAAATAIMCWTITAVVTGPTTFGSGYAAPVVISGYDTPPGSSVLTNPSIQSALVRTREARIVGVLSGTAITGAGSVIKDGGIYTAAPTMYAYGFIQGASAVQAVITGTMGGATDLSFLLPT